MNRTVIPALFTLTLIVLVGAGVSVLSWQYLLAVQAKSETTLVVARQPMVLGAQTERQQPIEEALAGEVTAVAILGQSLVVEQMRPSEVNDIFLHNCQRAAKLNELDEWVARNSSDLEKTLAEDCL
jgi:hypothetical protein